MRYRSLENEYAKLDLGLLLKPHSMTKIGNIGSSMEMRYIVLVVHIYTLALLLLSVCTASNNVQNGNINY